MKTDEADVLLLISEAIESVTSTKVTLAPESLDRGMADIGLDSVTSLEVIGRIEDRLGVDFPEDRLARVRTVRDLVALITR
ncbi:MAG TPA: acyl carrier protein [Polyangiaceae bacterium]|jgi:acyl carrier protein|nr:acyl carrier protein [Polyangiaceae bacterium]